LYDYHIDTTKLPRVFNDISQEILQKVYLDILDHMNFKTSFVKYENELDYYTIVEGVVVINDNIKEKYNKYFPRSDYLNMKDRVLDIEI
jgi:hypothetical protein